MGKSEIQEIVDELGLSITSEFIPFSKSPHSKSKERCLNWVVTIRKDGGKREIISTGYSVGIGHCPSYKQSDRSIYQDEAIKYETEHGRKMLESGAAGRKIEPDILDVLNCLVDEAETLEYRNFEDWASTVGYDTDSRSAENIYKSCLKTALTLRCELGDEGLEKLRKAFQDY